jgi:hypothetical protein
MSRRWIFLTSVQTSILQEETKFWDAHKPQTSCASIKQCWNSIMNLDQNILPNNFMCVPSVFQTKTVVSRTKKRATFREFICTNRTTSWDLHNCLPCLPAPQTRPLPKPSANNMILTSSNIMTPDTKLVGNVPELPELIVHDKISLFTHARPCLFKYQVRATSASVSYYTNRYGWYFAFIEHMCDYMTQWTRRTLFDRCNNM